MTGTGHTDVLIAGAGIAGLTAALALHARGLRVTVLEAAGQLQPLGVGINLQPAAADALGELGLRDDLASFAIPTSQSLYLTQDGVELARRSFGGAVQQFSVHRGQLQMMLYTAATARLPEGSIITGARVASARDEGSSVTVRTTGGDEYTGSAVLAADGVHSPLRAQLHPGTASTVQPRCSPPTTGEQPARLRRGTCKGRADIHNHAGGPPDRVAGRDPARADAGAGRQGRAAPGNCARYRIIQTLRMKAIV
ncbi:FAD-dependent oxidoreductase [Nocardia carnea]|uniref:FAD-dependent oxidoreductase n=1 Tax=Nocardia carnea TaxID=37328 RepID=UPI00245493C2|nr:FAD-dependent oxidoreductase [Nocardia carnea]